MQISKLLSAVCVAAFCASCIAVRAQDTPAQAAARAALMGKMNELGAQPAQPAPPPVAVTPSDATRVKPSQPTNVVVVPPPTVHARPAVPAPATKPASGTEIVQTMPVASDAEAQAKAKAALEQKMTELNQQNWATPAVTSAPPTQPVVTNAVKSTPPAAPPVVMPPPNPINPNYPGRELGLKPIVAPPLPIPPAKQAQLQGLLERYKSDQITPEQYQTERAKILAGP